MTLCSPGFGPDGNGVFQRSRRFDLAAQGFLGPIIEKLNSKEDDTNDNIIKSLIQ